MNVGLVRKRHCSAIWQPRQFITITVGKSVWKRAANREGAVKSQAEKTAAINRGVRHSIRKPGLIIYAPAPLTNGNQNVPALPTDLCPQKSIFDVHNNMVLQCSLIAMQPRNLSTSRPQPLHPTSRPTAAKSESLSSWPKENLTSSNST